MNKSISVFVFDTPENCDECRLMREHFDHGYGWIKECIGSGVNDCIVFERKLEDYCPLRHLPHKNKYDVEKYTIVDYENNVTLGHFLNKGYNECIDDILGE